MYKYFPILGNGFLFLATLIVIAMDFAYALNRAYEYDILLFTIQIVLFRII